jgi:DNA mismatch repair ATPase MutS
MIAAASFRKLIYYYCEPELTKSEKPFLSAKDLYHPLLETPVTNSISENRSVLLTGSNASGKSTFIKTLAINAILSQTIYTATATSYQGSYFMIYSSMALRDNIFSNESYYIVEIKSLKRILDHINPEIPMLCFIDEVLRGTNTLERIAASSRILNTLAMENALVFAATHDIELTNILEKNFSNYHFQERIEENQVLFDYKLHLGKAVSKNAIKLLAMLGYPHEIIDSAEQAAQDFLSSGEWSNL